MGGFTFTPNHPTKLSLFLNTSFLLLLSIYLLHHPSTSGTGAGATATTGDLSAKPGHCSGVHRFSDNKSKCRYVKSQSSCNSKGYINYIHIFYCSNLSTELGYSLLLLWLIILFYILGNTASDYFCSSLENLSRLLNLPPTIAGTTLLPLGNGATDVFSSIVSFTGSAGEEGDVGLNSVLGGAFFVSSIVVGVISILITSRRISVDKASFVRDVVFFLLSLCFLLCIAIVGRITFWVALCFLSTYFVYIFMVCAVHFCYNKKEGSLSCALLGNRVDEDKPILVEIIDGGEDLEEKKRARNYCNNLESPICVYLKFMMGILELPLWLPRRITIPVVSEGGWSKPFAVISVVLAPLLVAALWNTQKEEIGSKTSSMIYMIAGLVGFVLGNFALVATKSSAPPKRCLFPWLVGGFVMSITWTYVIAQELVSLLVSIGTILGINPSILGLTVLAWGNSIGDLIANAALATKGGPDGAQIAVSGCYAGPLFNTLVGLGLSLVFATWANYPSSYEIPRDPYLYETLGFLIGGLLWALVILPRRNMRLDRFLGSGLLAIYLCFLFLRLARTFGLLTLYHGS